MKRTITVTASLGLLAVIASGVISAAPPQQATQPVLLIVGERYFLLYVTQGQPSIVEINQVVRIGQPNPPKPPPAETVKAKVQQWTAKVNDPLIARGIAEGAYATVRDRVRDGSIDWTTAISILKAATDLAMNQSEKQDEWIRWRVDLGNLIDNLQREGKLSSKEQQVQFLSDVHDGMVASTKGAAIDLEKLLALIKLIIELIISLR